MGGIGDEPEGATPLDPDELDGLKFSHATTRGELDELEQINIESGLLWIQRRRKSAPLTEKFIRDSISAYSAMFGNGLEHSGSQKRTLA